MNRRIKEIIEEVLELTEDETDNLEADTDLCDLGLDSKTCVELVVNLEEEFDISIDEEDLPVENMCTIALIKDLIEKYS